MKILFLSRWFPYPTNNGSKLRIYNLLRGLSQCHDITLLSFTDQMGVNADVHEIKSICSDVYTVPWREFDPKSTRSRFGFLSRVPRSIVDTFSPEMARQIITLLSTSHYDLVIASQLSMAAYRDYSKGIPAIYEEVEIGLSYDKSHAINSIHQLRHAFTWYKLHRYLTQLVSSYQACTMASEQELQLFRSNFSLLNVALEVIPNGVDAGSYETHLCRRVANQIIFSGSFRYHPNYEAMLWYLEKVHPYVVAEIPDAQVVITGDHNNLPLPNTPNVTLTGYVNDVKVLIASSSVSIAPLLSGGGTRLKILEAMALGTPVVSTGKGTEGLKVQNGEHLLVADEPQKFARSIISILKNAELSERLSSAGRQLVQEHYDWPVIMPKFLQLVEKAARES